MVRYPSADSANLSTNFVFPRPGRYVLVLEVQDVDEGGYVRHVVNEEVEFLIDVQTEIQNPEGPSVSITSHSEPVQIEEGDSIDFIARVNDDSYPQPNHTVNVYWTVVGATGALGSPDIEKKKL